jgi:molybdopterin/thiamine biosynthesis adenylyltransferase
MHSSELIEVLDPREEAHAARLDQLVADGYEKIDTFDEQLAELVEIGAEGATDRWVAYPWRRAIVRVCDPFTYPVLRANRNLDLITADEQARYADSRIAFAGLNVGNPGATCVALEGGARAMSFADPDTLSLTNLNRFRAGTPDLGQNKALLTARQVLEIDPYYSIQVWEAGISEDTLEEFLEDAQLLVEEMDALPLKLQVRDAARARAIPVVMVTGNGPDVLIDVERYDTDPALPILSGMLVPDVEESIRSPEYSAYPFEMKLALARDFIGTAHLHKRLVQSFEKVGKRLAGIPQLAESSYLRGAAIAYAARTILTGGALASGRYSFSFDGATKL